MHHLLDSADHGSTLSRIANAAGLTALDSGANPIRRLHGFLSLLALLLMSPLASAQDYRPELEPYVEFLAQQETTAKDYVVSLFNDHDVVVLCERHHPEITQYDLFLSIISDPRFLDSVGNVFTEVGTISQAEEVNSFIHRDDLPTDSVDQEVLQLQRNCSSFFYWEKTNYSYFVRGLYELNQRLSSPRKVNLFNSDLPFDWKTMDSASLSTFQEHLVDTRDSIMAAQIIRNFDEIRELPDTRHKALVIMNYRHAFRHDTKNPQGVIRRNVGRFLFDRYRDRFANVFVNNVALVSARSDNDVSYAAIQGGKWDAAFKVANEKDLGFDFKGSPFGRDTFDLWPVNVNWTWDQEFDGIAFYLPLEEQRFVSGMPGFVDSVFEDELAKRFALYNTIPGGRRWNAADLNWAKDDLNVRRETPIYMMDSISAQIRKWLIK